MESQTGKIIALTSVMPIVAPEAHIEKLKMDNIPQLSVIIITRKI